MSLLLNSQRIPLLCYVTDRRSLLVSALSCSGDFTSPLVGRDLVGEEGPAKCREALLDRIRKAAEAGVDWIQLREKDLSGKECSQLTTEALRVVAEASLGNGAACPASSSHPVSAERAKACILVNDRLDVALAAQAGGVHLGERSLPPQEAQRLREALHREKDFLIGVSCHSLEAARTAAKNRADYIFFGPVFATPSKAAYGAPQGLERLAEVCRAVSIPVLAIGGITLENCAACFSAGASGIAAIRLFQDAGDMAALMQALRKAAD